jgi:hypothetical protein
MLALALTSAEVPARPLNYAAGREMRGKIAPQVQASVTAAMKEVGA